MAWKINKIDIENFKFFKDKFSLEIKGKHLLLYGENGSGKSSIYWSVYTFFQNCYKEQNVLDAGKYFNPESPENIRNRFSNIEDKSGIYIDFINVNDGRHLNYETSSERCNTKIAGDVFMPLTAAASDFMNYSFLSKIFDFRNSQAPEIFDIFLKDVFPSLILSNNNLLRHIDGSTPNETQPAQYWWKYLSEQISSLPRRKNLKYVLRSSEQFQQYKLTLEAFNNGLKLYLLLIETTANQIISTEFRIQAKIKLNYTFATIHNVQMGPDVDCDIELNKPKIYISTYIEHKKINEENKKVIHPNSFFNEAKLTCMSIALRLAIVRHKYNAVEDGVSALFLDDILISLDMSTRLKVIDIILNLSSRYQLFIFTHDRAFYNIIKNRIISEGHESEWKFNELYCLNEELTDLPECVLKESQDNICRAKIYLSTGDYFAAANAIRSQYEISLKKILPYKYVQSKINKKEISLSDYISLFVQFVSEIELNYPTSKLQFYRGYILNPLSHGDVRTPIYKEEIIETLQELIRLDDISMVRIVDKSHCRNSDRFSIHLVNDDNDKCIEFCFKEEYISYRYGFTEKFTNPLVKIVASDVENIDRGDVKLDDVYPILCQAVYGTDVSRYPKLSDVIKKM